MPSLLKRILQGDQQAVEKLYKEYSPRIYKYFVKRLPKEEDAEELMNDVFLDALDGLPLFQEKSTILTWLYKIAHNKIVDFYRKRKVKSLLLSQIPYLEIIDDEVHQPEFVFEKNKIRDKIETTLHSLSLKYRTILTLHYEENVSVKDLALKFHLSNKAAESLLFRARKSFQKEYGRT